MAREVIDLSDLEESDESEHTVNPTDHADGAIVHGAAQPSAVNTSPEHCVVDERSKSIVDAGASSRILTLDSSTSEYDTPMSDQSSDISKVAPFDEHEILVTVPPPKRPWEYRIYSDATVVRKVTAKVERNGELNYLVKFTDGQSLMVSQPSLCRVLTLDA